MIQKAKGKADAKPKARAKAKEKSKGKGSGKGMTAEEKKLVPCRQFQTADGCRFGDACAFKHEGVQPGMVAIGTILLETEPCDYHIACATTDADNKKISTHHNHRAALHHHQRAERSHQQKHQKPRHTLKFMIAIYIYMPYQKNMTARPAMFLA